MNDALRDFDSFIKKELETIDCTYLTDKRNSSIWDFITYNETEKLCAKNTLPPPPSIERIKPVDNDDKEFVTVITVPVEDLEPNVEDIDNLDDSKQNIKPTEEELPIPNDFQLNQAKIGGGNINDGGNNCDALHGNYYLLALATFVTFTLYRFVLFM